ncbi:uncharacterized protein [Clytia hemisphaerica]|uniref:uncharacterized protein n=1 Tax=Clytia hemisphaerica TaxID=252671 RepID=UPI0034D44BAD
MESSKRSRSPDKMLMFSILILQSIFFISALPTPENTENERKTTNDKGRETKRRDQLRRIIENTLGLDDSETSSNALKKFKESINPDLVKNFLSPSKTEEDGKNGKELIFLWKNDRILEQCQNGHFIKDLELRFLFNLEIFQKNTLASARIHFFKKNETPAERIIVKEIPNVGTHEHVINSALINHDGWAELDITKQVNYWTADYGLNEFRTLRLGCEEKCSELYVEHCDPKVMPFLSIRMKPNDEKE